MNCALEIIAVGIAVIDKSRIDDSDHLVQIVALQYALLVVLKNTALDNKARARPGLLIADTGAVAAERVGDPGPFKDETADTQAGKGQDDPLFIR